ncbi:MAG: UvrD-helicase domain-containing protein [Firmicutes bacterium]|nr:UvrD-helicase domain-containing protein [Bacillota bacterium]MCM1401662.1 UvrD-helicase domain-containing protein [Bacteroides sp.]MCM1477561.1 UvrD-helicase domain-containing protein [Bacteroides sp.]
MEDYLDKLNDQQRQAVIYTDGPALVIAGAGSGKTRVLTYKIVHLLQHGYEPWRILALTFTNKAAREMRQRIEQLVGERTASRLWMGTFHSIFLRILRQNAALIGFKPNFTIYDTADSKSLVKSLIKDMALDDKIYKPSIVLSAISTAKNALISPEKYATLSDAMEADRRARRPMIYALYRNYRDRCFASGAMDFDDLLYYTNLLLRDNPEVLHHYQEYFRYVLVDEYQDTNFAQHVIVSQLCKESHALCVVGDDAQSIYSFRGANISNILNLKRSYPELATFKLEQNYRSTRNIINAANTLIAKNTQQIPKNVFSKNSEGQPIEVVESYSDFEEGYLVANRISQVKMRSHDSYEEFAILYRTNAQSRVLEESLRKRNIPYRIYGGLSFYQRKEVKDALAYFRMAINPNDDEALKRIINFPGRGIGETTVNKLKLSASDNHVSIWEVISNLDVYNPGVNSGTAKKLNAFHDLISRFIEMNQQGMDAYELAQHIIAETHLLTMLLSDHTPENLSKQENLNELIAGAKEFVTNRKEEGNENLSLADFIGEVSLATDQDAKDADDGERERVTLMTVHAAKGLEFNNVFIVGVEEDLFPSSMANGNLMEIEEERRLLYVALTRARNFCMMSFAKSRYRNGQTAYCSPSRFLRDIDPRYLKLSSGASLGSQPGRFESFASSYHSSTLSSGRNKATEKRDPSRWVKVDSTSNDTSPNRPLTTAASRPGTHRAVELSTGMTIEHSRFGRGVIKSIDTSRPDAERIEVVFDNTDTRILLLKFAQFTIIPS